MRPLFSDAPMMQQAQQLPTQPVGSQLAAAMSRPTPMPSYGSPAAPQIPMSTLMQAMQARTPPSAPTLNSAPPQGGITQPTNAPWTASTAAPPPPPNALQQLMPQMPGQISGANPNAAPDVPGLNPGQASPGMFSGMNGMFGGMFGGQ